MSFKSREPSFLPRLRRIIESLPRTSEKLSHGAPTWWGGKRTFACYHSGGYDEGRPAIWFKAPPGMQEELISVDPDRFYRPKDLGPAGWVALRLSASTHWEEVEALLATAHNQVVS